jgi:hypothetical protein
MRTELETALARLAARGDLIELRSGHYAVTARSREFAVGRLNMHRDGYGFLISDRPIEGVQGDVFIPPESAEKAMHGDRVVVRIARIEAGGRADGEIVKVLQARAPHGGGRVPLRQGAAVRGAARRPHPAVDRDSRRHGDAARGPVADRPHRRGPRAVARRRAGRHGGQRRVARIPGARREAGGARDRDPGPPRRFRSRRGDRHPQAPPAAPFSARGGGAGAGACPSAIAEANWRGGATSAAWTS